MAAEVSPLLQQNGGQKKKKIVVTDPPKFDLEGYIQNYQGRTRLGRLLLIGTTSTFLGVDALKLAVVEAKRGRDTHRYTEAQLNLKAHGPNEPEAAYDADWVHETVKKNQHTAARLESELKGYKNNLIKESVRMGNEELGLHYQATGELNKAFEAFSRMRQDVSLGQQIVDICKHLIEVSIEQKNWVAVSTNIQKIKGVQCTPEESENIQPFIMAAEGLSFMDNGDFLPAAKSFLAVGPGMGSSCNTIISPNDIAVYGGLCALASMNRNELQQQVLENSTFRSYLELEPHIRKAISFFVNSRYSACLNILEQYRPDYLLDIHLQKQIDEIYHQVRSKSIVQYFIPFSCVTLDSLNESFAAPGRPIDKELAKMIERKELEARIDTQSKLLVSVPSVPRAKLQIEALQAAKDYEREARLHIQHINIRGADLEVKGKKQQSQFAQEYDDIHGNDSYSGSSYTGGRQLGNKSGY